jgi:hypothetical protein
VTSTSTRSYSNLAPDVTATTTSAITWEFSGVALTWPTTYLAYTDFSHFYLSPQSSTSICFTTSSELHLPDPTNYTPLIFPASATPGPELPPAALVDYLNAQPTIIQQMGGTTIGQSCDPIAGPVVSASTSTPKTEVVYTSTHVLAEESGTTTTATAVAAQTSGNAATVSPSTTLPTPVATVTAPVATITPPTTTSTIKSTTTPILSVLSSSSAPLQVSTAAARGWGDMRFEGWLVGVVGAIGVL